MQHIETVAEVNHNGFVTISLPTHIRPGKHHMFLVIDEALSEESFENDHSPQLMQMAGCISAFNKIGDPILWQQQQRDEWQSHVDNT